MKKIKLIIFITLFSSYLFAQVPHSFNYQAVARDNSGNVLTNKTVALRISILDISATGTAVYVEKQNPTTNQFGLFSIQIGSGSIQSGIFTNINWGVNSKFLKVEMDSNNGTSYTLVGTSQLLSVPYALYSESTGDTTLWRKSGSNIYYNKGKIGIGTNSPKLLFNIVRTSTNNSSMFRLQSNIAGVGSNIQMMGSNYNKLWALTTNGDYSGISFRLADTTENNIQEFFNITDKGCIGIGTVLPRASLHIQGRTTIQADSAHAIFGIKNYVIGAPQLYLYATSNTNGAAYGINAQKAGLSANGNLVINEHGGNVGIGINTPQRTLHVNAVMRLEPISVAPSSPAKGDMYFDSIINKLRVYDGSAWQNCW